MKEKTWKKLYFSVFLLLLFLMIFVPYHNIQKENSLDVQIENSYQEMINNTKNNMLQEYQTKYGLSEEDFEEYWEDFETSEEFKILEVEYKEEYRTDYEELEKLVPLWKKGVVVILSMGLTIGLLILSAIETPMNLVLTAGLIVGFYFLLR